MRIEPKKSIQMNRMIIFLFIRINNYLSLQPHIKTAKR